MHNASPHAPDAPTAGPRSALRAVEFFCGIGGMAAAAPEAAVVAAIDINRAALDVYTANFPHRAVARELETIPAATLRTWEADLWWLSPPCQPYTRRGRQRDVDDPRARSLLALIAAAGEVRPRLLALENVPPFATSQARERLCEALDRCGYAVGEQIVCPTQLGIPMRRRRYYLTAALHREAALSPVAQEARLRRPLDAYLLEEADDDPRLGVDPGVVGRYAGAVHILDRRDADAIANCFTSAYGRSHVRSGSFVRSPRGVRRFSPREILNLMGFGEAFHLPPSVSLRKAWELVGNSLSVDVVRRVLQPILEPAADSR